MTAETRTAPRFLVLWAEESSPNLGVAALARGSRDLLRRVDPDAEFVFANYGARPTEIPWGRPRSLVRERIQNRFGMQAYLRQFDLVWDTRSGDSFADIYGIDRHLTMSLVHEFAVQAGTPVAMAPQTIGPFGTRRGRLLGRRTLHRSTTVLARDPDSVRAADQLGRPADLMTADLVFAIDPPTPGPSHDVLFNVSGLLWQANSHVDAHAYRRVVRESIAGLRAAGRDVTLLAHVLDSPHSDNDVPVVRELSEESGGELDVVVPTSLDDVRSTIAGASVLIGSRMHACLNALSVGVPSVPLAYSRKFAPLLRSVGWDVGFDLRTDDPVSLPSRIIEAVEHVDPAGAREAAAKGRASLDAAVDLLRTVQTRGEPLVSPEGRRGR